MEYGQCNAFITNEDGVKYGVVAAVFVLAIHTLKDIVTFSCFGKDNCAFVDNYLVHFVTFI